MLEVMKYGVMTKHVIVLTRFGGEDPAELDQGRICATTIFRSAGSRHCGSSRSQKRTGACACFAALMPAGTAFGRAPIAALVSMEGIGAGAEAPPLRVSARD
jgi:hypothetical protein